MSDTTQLEKRLKELQLETEKVLGIIEIEKKKNEDPWWTPEENEAYCYISSSGNTSWTTYISTCNSDAQRAKLGNCFRTVEEAELAALRWEVDLKLRHYAKVMNEVGKEACWVIYFNESGCMNTFSVSAWLTQEVCFTSREIGEFAANLVGLDKIRKAWSKT